MRTTVRRRMTPNSEIDRTGRRSTDQILGNLEGRLAGIVEAMQKICDDCTRHQKSMEELSKALNEHIAYHRTLDQESVKANEKSRWHQQVALTTRTVLISAGTTLFVLVINHFWK